jgi:hypothetical protein
MNTVFQSGIQQFPSTSSGCYWEYMFQVFRKSDPFKFAGIYPVHSLFNDAFSNSDHVTSNSKMTANDKLDTKCKEAVMAKWHRTSHFCD